MIKKSYTLKNNLKEDDNTTVRAKIELDNNRLLLAYQVTGNLSCYHFPKATKQKRADKLWLDSCFELFIAPIEHNEYWELNLSPSTAWNCYYFKDYKDGMRESDILSTPKITTHQESDGYRLCVESIIQKEHLHRPFLINLCVILLDRRGERHFYSIKRANGTPDFHHRDYFDIIFPKKAPH